MTMLLMDFFIHSFMVILSLSFVNLLAVFYILVCIKEKGGSPTSYKRMLVYNDGDYNWDTSVQACKAIGGYLVNIHSIAVEYALLYYASSSSGQGWENIWGNVLWSGLYVSSFSGSTQNLNMQGTCESYDYTNSFTNWDDGSIPSADNAKRCVALKPDTLKWFIEANQQEYSFICEVYLGDCTFEESVDKCVSSADGSRTIITSDLASCQTYCKGISISTTECWAVTFNSNTRECAPSIHSNPFNFESKSGCSQTILSHKRCFEAGIYSGSVTTVNAPSNGEPNPDCSFTAPAANDYTTTSSAETTQSETSSSTTTEAITSTMADTTSSTTTKTTTTITLAETTSSTTTEATTTSTMADTTSSTTTKTTTTITLAETTSSTTNDATTATQPLEKTSSTTPVTTVTQQETTSSTTLGVISKEFTQKTMTSSQSETTPESTDQTSSSYPVIQTESTASASSIGACICHCQQVSNVFNATVIDLLVEKLVKELTVNAKKTSKAKRKLISVKDMRPSSIAIGGTICIVVITGFFSLFVLPDALRCIVWLKRICFEARST